MRRLGGRVRTGGPARWYGGCSTRDATTEVHHLVRYLFTAREELARSQRRFGARGRREDVRLEESALWGTTKVMASIQDDESDEMTLYAQAISHSETLSARRGRKHFPRCGSVNLYSPRRWRVSDSYS